MLNLTLLRRAVSTAAVLVPAIAAAQQGGPATNADSANRARSLRTVTVTATRRSTDVHDVAQPVNVLDSTVIRSKLPNTAADLLREIPGVDVIGTGVNQARPVIRGQRGQRILLLQDGIRMNNSRRQQDFGEIPALVDVSSIERVEIVRGPASVLYGTDAIGGVINMIGRAPSFGTTPAINGRVGYEYGSAGSLSKVDGRADGHAGSFAYMLSGNGRVAGDYDAPSGTFGNVKLANKTTLLNSGVRDHNVSGSIAWRAGNGATVFVRAEQYVADKAGFGYVPPSVLGGDQTKIEILYPHQDFQKLTTGLTSGTLHSPLADKIEVTAYASRNKRDLAQNIFAPFGPGTPPGAGANIKTYNFTDLGTVGGRAEATKVAANTILTYGIDVFRDRSVNTDSSRTTIVGFGPPIVQTSKTAQVPNATLASFGTFVQGDVRIHEQFSVILGGRWQNTTSTPTATAGRTDALTGHDNSTFVYAANAIYRATPALSVVASVGRGFRSPNLVERYFDGPTPEGSAYQSAAPDLKPETSVNYDGGFKFRDGRVVAEAFVFQNDIKDAVTIAPTGAKKNNLPVYTNVNVGALRAQGVELAATVLLARGFSVSGNYSTLKSKNVANPALPIGDTYANKLNLALGWTERRGRLWAEYAVRRNGDQKDIVVGSSPVGNVLPAFTVQSIRGGIRGWTIAGVRQDLTVIVNNLANVLYAETANSSFFRPEPGRLVKVAISTGF
jgi:outer membrane receptor protein involved in Fe transport